MTYVTYCKTNTIRIITKLLAGLGLLFLMLSLALWAERRAEITEIKASLPPHLQSVIADPNLPQSALVIHLLDWVYHQNGFAQNTQYFGVFKALGPTPYHIFQSGGDCADKSRLLSSLLNEYGIKSTLVMLYPCETCRSTHTVVEAETELGRMAVDPVYNIVFPKKRSDEGFYSIAELGEDVSIIEQRIAQLIDQRGELDKAAFYDKFVSGYAETRTINWRALPWLDWLTNHIFFWHTDKYHIYRPHFLEDPQRLLMYSLVIFGIGLLLSATILNVNHQKNS